MRNLRNLFQNYSKRIKIHKYLSHILKRRTGRRVTLPDTETYFKAINKKQCNTITGIKHVNQGNRIQSRCRHTHVYLGTENKTKAVSQINRNNEATESEKASSL